MAKANKKKQDNNYKIDIGLGNDAFLDHYVFGDTDLRIEELMGDPIDTGIIPLNIILNGGIRDGDILMLYSAEGIGKTTIALQTCRKLIEGQGRKVMYVDVESGIRNQLVDFKLVQHYKDGNFRFVDNFKTVGEVEKLFDSILAKPTLPFDVIVLDSITNLLDDSILTRSVIDPMMCGQAKAVTAFLQKYRVLFKERGIITFLINQERANLDAKTKYDPKSIVAGCRALKYVPDVILKLGKGEAIKEFRETINGLEEVEIGRYLKVVADKNRKCNAKIPVTFPLRFGVGISNIWFLTKILKDKEYVKQAGAYFKTSIIPNPSGGDWSLKGKLGLETWVDANYDAIKTFLDKEGVFKLILEKDELAITEEEDEFQ